jgi:hypothetical protein
VEVEVGWAITLLNTIVEKQENASIAININPGVIDLLFVLYNSGASNLQLIFEGLLLIILQ